MTWPGLVALAGRPGGDADIRIIQHQDKGLVINTVDSEIYRFPWSQKRCPVDMYGIATEMALKLCHESLLEHGDRCSVLILLGAGNLARSPEPNDTSHVFRSTSQPKLLVMSAADERGRDGDVLGIKSACALGAMDFVG